MLLLLPYTPGLAHCIYSSDSVRIQYMQLVTVYVHLKSNIDLESSLPFYYPRTFNWELTSPTPSFFHASYLPMQEAITAS